MHLFVLFFGIIINKIYANSNFNSDYPNVTICVIPELHAYTKLEHSYIYLKTSLGLDRNCTHISGSLRIQNIHRLNNGFDPDLSFLESIVEISGVLEITETSVKRIPLGNLKIIRGITMTEERYSLAIHHNKLIKTYHLEVIDLHNLRAIMNKDVRLNDNYGLDYLTSKVNWSEIILNSKTQNLLIQSSTNNKNITIACHPNCARSSMNPNNIQFCFGPSELQCQKTSKCSTDTEGTWCYYNKGIELPCDPQCAGGCHGRLSRDCVVCNGVYKKDKCVSHCAAEQSKIFGHYDENVKEDKLIYTTGALCTSHCPDSLLDQDKVCLFNCDFSKYYKKGDRCLECPNQNCNNQIGDQLMCDLRKLDPNYPSNGRKYKLNKETLIKLTNCTVILGQFSIDDTSFKFLNVSLPLLYKHLSNVREVMGEVIISLFNTDVKNLTFLPNLKEIRGTYSTMTTPGLKVLVDSIEFLGLKKLKKVYGIVNLNHGSKLCYADTIPWHDITKDPGITRKCDKKCHPLCTRGCWGPGNKLCYKCPFMEAGEYCVEKCEDAPEYYTWVNQLNVSKKECRKCHPLCKEGCTGPSSRECTKCLKAKENGNCVNSCSESFYAVISPGGDNVNCVRCHDSCYVGALLKDNNISSACSGPLSILGKGGCSICNKIIVKDNVTSCHKGDCPRGFFNDFQSELSIQKISCNVCHEFCEECTAMDTKRHSCQKCKHFWYKDQCQSNCSEKVSSISRKIKPGDECPSCHAECYDGCLTENNNSTCIRCEHKKLFKNSSKQTFYCVPHCPMERNHSEMIDGDFVCLTYEETLYYKQQRKILFIILGCLLLLVFTVISIVFYFRFKSKQSKIKAALYAYYSNFNQPNMKNLPTDHLSRPPNMNRLQMIPISDLIFDTDSKPLGVGAFGKVYRGDWNALGDDGNMYPLTVVVKVLHNSSKASINEFLDEAQIMASVCHRHCLPLIGVCLSLEKPCLVSSFAKYGSLDKYLVQYSTTIPSLSLIKWSEQIADGMTYLNLRGIIHRDLAARNILLSQETIVQITDFGLARLVDDTDDGIVVQSGRVPIRWLALETLLYSNYSTASDIWAYGVTLWEIFTFGKRPYEKLDTSKIKVFLQEGNRLPQPDICTLEVYMVMIKCWLEEPQMRPSFKELMTTFELFSRNSKRYLCLPSEHHEEYPHDANIEAISLRQISSDAESRPFHSLNARSDYNFSNQTSHNDSTYHLIHPSYVEEPSILPMRKKTKRTISFDRFKGFPMINLTKVKSNKSVDSKIIQYRPRNQNDYLKSACMSYDSSTGLISSQRSSECESLPHNPQITKLLSQENWQSARNSKHMSKNYLMSSPERIFNDKEIENEDINSLMKPSQILNIKTQNLPPIDIHKFESREPLIENPLKQLQTKEIRNSPDSGNSQDFEADDYLVPSRVQSLGYYNLTPSPSTINKPTMDLNNCSTIINNESNLLLDDEYLEPTSKLTN